MIRTAIILAAGAGSRLGVPKALLHVEGESALERAVRLVRRSSINNVFAVVGCEAASIRGRHDGLPVEFVVNERWHEGDLLSSLQCGWNAAGFDRGSCLVHLVDHVAVLPAVVETILDRASSEADIIKPCVGGQSGHPVVMSPAVGRRLAGLPVGASPRDVLRDPSLHELRLDVSDPGVLFDVDTPHDIRRAKDEFNLIIEVGGSDS